MSIPGETAMPATVAEKRALLARLLQQRETARPSWSGLRQMFEAQATRTPEAIAVDGPGGALTYRQLDAAANRLARRLLALGLGVEGLVGVCLERSPQVLVALLGITKAGGAYVPLDPAFPQGRLAMMVEDSRLYAVVTQRSLVESVPTGDAQVVLLNPEWDEPDQVADGPPAERTAPGNLAYVLYTSGSTGRPKGVQVSHEALANFLKSMRASLGVTERDVLLAVTTLSFDIAGLELFLPLLAGGRVEVAAREVSTEGAALASRLDRGDVTILQATPATWRMLLDGGWAGSAGLSMLCGGEALSRSLADRLLGKGKVLWNLYGPTETTIWSSAGKVEAGDAPIAIGGPIDNTRLMVLDARMRPVPVGVTGELFIGGAGVARGYLHRPGLTAERFAPDPFGKAPGARVYRSGDLARWRADGALECLGRVDQQVKVRGFRVELGEIEAALSAHPAVREAAVVARPDAAGENALVGYWSARPGPAPEAAELRQALRDALPEYMIPAHLVRLDALPLTPNGKLDRNALPAPGGGQADVGEAYVPPRGPVEEALAGIWQELLGLDRVGVRDNFFDIGGHSLFATQLIARLRDTFAVEPSLREFIEEPTVAGLAKLVDREMAAGAGVKVPPIGPAPRDGPVPASFAQQRLWFLDQLQPGSAAYNIPTAVRLVGVLDVGLLRRALNEVVRRHESLRTTFAATGGVPFQVIAPEVLLDVPIHQAGGGDPEVEALLLVAAEARRPFDLAVGPLIRASLIRVGEREHIVAVTIHHIVSDGWSVGVLIREVAALYDAFRAGKTSPLPDPVLQYADYAAWQRGWLRGEALDLQLDYWKGRLGGVPHLELPTDRPRPAAPSGVGGERSTTIPAATLAAVRAVGRKEGATLYMALLAAFEVLLHRYTGQVDFAVGTPIAGRTRSEMEDLIGLFVNTLVLRADLAGDPSFRELLRRVKPQALGAYAHQDLPFDRLVGALHPDRDPSRSPLFQAMLVLQNAPMPIPQAPGLVLTPISTPSGTAKYELTLSLTEAAEGTVATIEYAADLFQPSTVDRMLAHYRTLLEAVAADPDQPVGSLAMLTAEETRRLLDAGGGDEGLEDLGEDELDAMLRDLEAGEADDDV